MRIRTVGLVIAGAAAIAGIAGGVAYATDGGAPVPNNVPSVPIVQLDQPVQDQQPAPGEDCPFGERGQAAAPSAESL